MSKRIPVIVCAACQYNDIIFTGARHFDKVMKSQINALEVKPRPSEIHEGFIDQFGKFYNRRAAFQIVMESRQPYDESRNGSNTVLYSEGIY